MKVDRAILVLIEDVEHIIGQFARVTPREKLSVYLSEPMLVEFAGGAVV